MTTQQKIENQFADYMSSGLSQNYPAFLTQELGKSANGKDILRLMKWRGKFYYADYTTSGSLKPKSVTLSTGNE